MPVTSKTRRHCGAVSGVRDRLTTYRMTPPRRAATLITDVGRASWTQRPPHLLRGVCACSGRAPTVRSARRTTTSGWRGDPAPLPPATKSTVFCYRAAKDIDPNILHLPHRNTTGLTDGRRGLREGGRAGACHPTGTCNTHLTCCPTAYLCTRARGILPILPTHGNTGRIIMLLPLQTTALRYRARPGR